MWAYDDDRGRRARDVPTSRPAYPYDDAYDRMAPRSSRAVYEDPQPEAQTSPRDRHRRKSMHTDPDETRPPRRSNRGGVSIVASDDELGHPPARRPRDAYGSSYAERASRHDAEAKTSDRNRHFRDKRGTWESGEARNLRRAKSYSPSAQGAEREEQAERSRNASPHAARSGWPDDDYTQTPGHHRSSRKNRAPKQYYEEDPRAGYPVNPRSRSRTNDRGASGYEYPPSAADMPRPPMGEQTPYKSAPVASQAAPEEKPGRHSRRREKDYYGSGYDDVPTNGAGYDRGGYGVVDEPPRRSRHSKKYDDKPGRVDADYPPQTPRGRHRSQPAQDDDDDDDPYERVQPRPRHRQSMPPQARSRHADHPYDETYGKDKPSRRATSLNHGDSRRSQYYDDAYGRSGGAGSGGGSKKDRKGKKWPQQAGQLFMTHAVPVIKKEAVPFLTKAAQAYIEQQRAR